MNRGDRKPWAHLGAPPRHRVLILTAAALVLAASLAWSLRFPALSPAQAASRSTMALANYVMAQIESAVVLIAACAVAGLALVRCLLPSLLARVCRTAVTAQPDVPVKTAVKETLK